MNDHKITRRQAHRYLHELVDRDVRYVGVNAFPCLRLLVGTAKFVRFATSQSKPQLPRTYHREYGDCSVLVRCPWRLTGPRGMIAGSGDSHSVAVRGLVRLRGARLVAARLSSDCSDLMLSFADKRVLTVFSDALEFGGAKSGNWNVLTSRVQLNDGAVRFQFRASKGDARGGNSGVRALSH